jgi:hypothetical protein
VRATLRLTLACDNRCVFCAQRGLEELPPPVTRQPLERRLRQLRLDADEITFTGGEPLLSDELAPAIVRARALGFLAIGLQTNGSTLAERAAELAALGLTDVHLSLHGAEAPVHDYHTGRDGSFARLLAAVAAARAAGLSIAITTVITRSNFRVLAALPPLLRSRGVAAWLLTIPRAAGGAAHAFDRVVPRLGLAMPFALHALHTARTLALPAFVQGAPLCLLGPFAARALPDTPRAYHEVCGGCPARTACVGIDPHYVARFGGDELTPRDASALDPVESPLQRLFVGVGELAPPHPIAAAAPPAAARRELPLIGKVQPALREVARGAPKQSGAALRELFPALFEKEPD